jgi:4-hydroxybenzoate polyprenyltransferase
MQTNAETIHTADGHASLGDVIRSSRPISWINTAFPFGAAYLLAGGGPDWTFWIGCLFFLIPYNLAMYGINDVFDYESDLRNPRKGGVEGHLVPPGHHHTIITSAILSCLPFVAYFVVVGSWAMVGVLALSLFAVAAYSVKGLRFKEVPILDSVTSSVHFSSPAWFALACVGAWPDATGARVLLAFFLWGVASQAFGAVQDVGPDRAAGLKSVATVLGARATCQLAVLLYAVAGVLVAFAPWPLWLGSLLAVPYLVMAGRFWNISDEDSTRAHDGWKFFIRINYVVGFFTTVLMIIWKVVL